VLVFSRADSLTSPIKELYVLHFLRSTALARSVITASMAQILSLPCRSRLPESHTASLCDIHHRTISSLSWSPRSASYKVIMISRLQTPIHQSVCRNRIHRSFFEVFLVRLPGIPHRCFLDRYHDGYHIFYLNVEQDPVHTQCMKLVHTISPGSLCY